MTPNASMRDLWITTAAAAWLFGIFCVRLGTAETVGSWLPPATLVCGLGWAANRGAVGAAVLAAWAGVLHAAATGGPVGVSLAVGAALAAAVRVAGLGPVRSWVAAGLLGWGWSVAVRAAAVALGEGLEPTVEILVEYRELTAAAGFGVFRAGVAATLRGEPPRTEPGRA